MRRERWAEGTGRNYHALRWDPWDRDYDYDPIHNEHYGRTARRGRRGRNFRTRKGRNNRTRKDRNRARKRRNRWWN